MGTQFVKLARRPRADAIRNRERVLEAAKAVFSAGGGDASLEAVARQAGVGIGTLYRHFPTREALFEAVYRHEVEHLSDLADELKIGDPVEALRQWMTSNIQFVATKKGMLAALALTMSSASPDLTAYSAARLTAAVRGLLDRAIAAGAIRADIEPEDLLRALVGMCYINDRPDWQASVLRLVDVLVDGMRVISRSAPVDVKVSMCVLRVAHCQTNVSHPRTETSGNRQTGKSSLVADRQFQVTTSAELFVCFIDRRFYAVIAYPARSISSNSAMVGTFGRQSRC
jgi:AcrR family transcriptional regulator